MKAKVVVPIALCVLIALVAIKLTSRPRSAEGFRDGSRVRVTERTPKEPESRSRTPQNGAPTVPEPPATVAALQTGAGTATHDFDGNGYVGAPDYLYFETCLDLSGPGRTVPFTECRTIFDADGDEDVDLSDFAAFQRARGHLPMPLKDPTGQVITIGSTRPYSGRQTCGAIGCHDAEHISQGAWFQDGRTDVDRNLDMRDDYNNDGRFWIKSAGRYGRWGQSFQFLLAAKENTRASDMDQTTFAWVRDCSGCHPGGGPGELDRDNKLHYNETTGQFGYELLGKTPEQVALDGDYSVINYSTGAASLAPWDVTGLSGPDCLKCHRTQRTVVSGNDMNVLWRRSTLAAGSTLVDNLGDPVPAFAAAGTAGQGWFSNRTAAVAAAEELPPWAHSTADALFMADPVAGRGGTAAAPILQIDYNVGVTDGSLMVQEGGGVALTPYSLTWPPKDYACWGCHPYGTIAGTVWFDARDIHYRKFNRLNDASLTNDIGPSQSRVCVVCHPGQVDHDIAKGNSPQLHYRDPLDWKGFRTCRNCHLTQLPNGDPNPLKHPEAPDVPGDDLVHITSPRMLEVLSCQACHIPYALASSVLFRDITVPGSVGMTTRYYSADPLDPSNPDKSRWYPPLIKKMDSDGVERLFPANIWITIYFGNWDQNGTPDDLTDDVISPIPTWRVAQVVGPTPLAILTDDDGDGRKEINRPEEILAYFERLKGNDLNGVQVSANPVLVRGKRVWYADPGAETGVNSFEHVGAGIAMDAWYPYLWSMDHNVLAKTESWGSDPIPDEGCRDCHRPDTLDSPVFDRLILVDPLGPDGQTAYEKVRTMTGLNPP